MQPTVTGFAARWLVASAAVLLLAAAPAVAQVCEPDPYQPRHRPPASEVIATAGISDTLPRVETPGPMLHWWLLGAAPTPLLVLGSLLLRRSRRRHHEVGDLPRSLAT
jgi:hypothetical protein